MSVETKFSVFQMRIPLVELNYLEDNFFEN